MQAPFLLISTPVTPEDLISFSLCSKFESINTRDYAMEATTFTVPPTPRQISYARSLAQLQRDNQSENPASIRMRTRVWGRVGRA